MPRLRGEGNLIDQPIYDTVQLAVAATQTVTFFAVPRGGVLAGAVTKGIQHTNLIQNGTLESGTTFVITGFSLAVRELASGGTFVSLVDSRAVSMGFVEVFFGQVSYFQFPSSGIPNGGMELNYFSNIIAAATEFKVNRGVSVHQNRYTLTQPIEIMNQESFSVTLTLPGAIAAVTDVIFVMWGNMLRPVR